jgi:hypothetical protein
MNPTTTAALSAFFLSPALLGLAASIYLVLQFATKQLPDKITSSSIFARLQPMLPELMGMVLTFTGAYKVPAEFQPWVMQHIVTGLWMGMLASKAYKIVDQTLLGNDSSIKKV